MVSTIAKCNPRAIDNPMNLIRTSGLLCVLCVSAFILSGCGTPKGWYRPNASAQQTEMDKADCRLRYRELVLGTPHVNVSVAAAAGPGATADAGGGVPWNQTLIGGAVERGHFVDDCMEAKGYQLVPVSQIPTNQP